MNKLELLLQVFTIRQMPQDQHAQQADKTKQTDTLVAAVSAAGHHTARSSPRLLTAEGKRMQQMFSHQ